MDCSGVRCTVSHRVPSQGREGATSYRLVTGRKDIQSNQKTFVNYMGDKASFQKIVHLALINYTKVNLVTHE